MDARRRRWIIAGALAIASAGGVGTGAYFLFRKTPLRPFLVKKNGGWCWYQDERALVKGDRVLVGTVAGATRDGSNPGDVEVTVHDLTTHTSATSKLHEELQADDHVSPALLELADGRWLAAYTMHGGDALLRYRVGANDASSWSPESTLQVGGPITYSNLAFDPENGRILDFFRGGSNAAQFAASTDGTKFSLGGTLFSWSRASPSFDASKSTRTSPPKPYIRYAARGGVVHFIATEDHPRAYDNSVYHGYVRGNALYDSFGNVLDDDLSKGPAPELTRLTRIYEGDRDHVAWTLDVDVDAEGRPFAAFVVQRDGQGRSSKSDLGGNDHRYHLARFDGTSWHQAEVAYAGHMLYKHEVNYTGLVALVPKNPDVVFMSSDVDPTSGAPLSKARHWQLFRGATKDAGATWTWRKLTDDEETDNLRPLVPERDGPPIVLWLRGHYDSMNAFDLDVFGAVDPGP